MAESERGCLIVECDNCGAEVFEGKTHDCDVGGAVTITSVSSPEDVEGPPIHYRVRADDSVILCACSKAGPHGSAAHDSPLRSPLPLDEES